MRFITSGRVVLLACATLISDVSIPQARGPSSREIEGKAKMAVATALARPIDRADLEAWLERLKGRFKIEGKSDETAQCGRLPPGSGDDQYSCTAIPPSTRYVSEVECQSVGSGAGVRCVFKAPRLGTATSQGFREFESRPARTLDDIEGDIALGVSRPAKPISLPTAVLPIRALYGMDPVARNISFMWVGNTGSGPGATGSLEDDTVTFKITQCGTRSAEIKLSMSSRCDATIRIQAQRDGKVIRIWFDSTRLSSDLAIPIKSTVFLVLQRVEQKVEGETPEAPPASR